MRRKIGFTLVEVALFLAITGVIFVGIAVGTQNTISQQRTNDTVQNFAEFLRTVYSEVSNPQGIGDGRSEFAIYGKLVTFDEEYGLDGELNVDHRIFVYDVIGDVDANKVSTGSVTELLKTLEANIVVVDEVENKLVPAGIIESYAPRWGAVIETTTPNTIYKGALLVVKHPKSGTINTLVLDNSASGARTIEVNKYIRNSSGLDNLALINPLKDEYDNFKVEQVDYCINMFAGEVNRLRQDIRLAKNARNASGIEIVSIDSDDDRCRID